MQTSRDLTGSDSNDKSLGSFILLSGIFTSFIFITSLALFILHTDKLRYISGLFDFLAQLALFILFLSTFVIVIVTIYIYRTKRINPLLILFARLEKNYLMPLLIAGAASFKNLRNDIRRFFVYFNNIVTLASKRKYPGDKILVLLPHCLQYSECPNKITNSIESCSKCMKCSIGKVRVICEDYKIGSIKVVTGGTAARNVIPGIRPELIIAVACERDLVSGIEDVKSIPVLGIFNRRPNGPCFNTTMDTDEFKEILSSVIDKPDSFS